MSRTTLALGFMLAFMLAPATGLAQTPPAEAEPPVAPDPQVTRARSLYKQGVELVRQAQWANALAAFERSAKLRPHATTTFNIGACERAMGRYTRARERFRMALARNERAPEELADSLAAEARGFVAEIDRLVAKVQLRVAPPGTAVALDGRPLAKRGSVYLAGLKPPGKGEPLGAPQAVVEMDPGAHVITLSRKGYTDVVLNETFAPGSTRTLDLQLEKLPAVLSVSSNVEQAIVSVDGKDFGPTPVRVLRPAGKYEVLVTKQGFEPYEALVEVQAGEQSALRATMVEETELLTEKWWFWTAAGAVVIGGAVATYALTRPDPEPPPYDGGSTGWVVRPSGLSF